MKFKKGINNLFVFLAMTASLFACGTIKYPFSESHTYQYTRVTRNGANLFEVKLGDTMNLLADGRFNYCIYNAKKNAYGTWRLINSDSAENKKAFEFTYFPEGQKRLFEICRYNRKTLILCEGPLRFEYRRIR